MDDLGIAPQLCRWLLEMMRRNESPDWVREVSLEAKPGWSGHSRSRKVPPRSMAMRTPVVSAMVPVTRSGHGAVWI
jgi:hypothetical protein